MHVKYKLNENSKNPLRNLDLFSFLKTLKVWFSVEIFLKNNAVLQEKSG